MVQDSGVKNRNIYLFFEFWNRRMPYSGSGICNYRIRFFSIRWIRIQSELKSITIGFHKIQTREDFLLVPVRNSREGVGRYGAVRFLLPKRLT